MKMGSTASTDERVSELERKYIQLLEQRVAELEARTGPRSGSEVTVSKEKLSGKDNDSKVPNEGTEDKATSAEEDDSKNKTSKEHEKPKEDNQETSRYRIVLNQLDHSTGEYVDRTSTLSAKIIDKSKKQAHAFTFRKFLRTQIVSGEAVVKATGSEVIVESETLQKLLARIISKYKDMPTRQLKSPFQYLIWLWDDAVKEAEPHPEDSEQQKRARVDLKELLALISTSSGDEVLDRYFKTRGGKEETTFIAFELLWTLFPPGSLILSRPFLKQDQVFMVQSLTMPDVDDDPDPALRVIANSFDWNGVTFNRVPYQLSIRHFPDKKRILELPFYPLNEHTDILHASEDQNDEDSSRAVESIKATLVERGKKYVRYCVADRGKQTFQYNGLVYHHRGSGLFRTASSSSSDDDDASVLLSSPRLRRYMSYKGQSMRTASEEKSVSSTSNLKDSVVVVDFKSYFAYQAEGAALLGDLKRYTGDVEYQSAEKRKNLENVYRYTWDKHPGNKELSEEQLLLCPPRVLGYSLAQKRWVQMGVDWIKERTAADRTNFDEKLQLREEHKSIIRNSVLSHGKLNITDYIPGKGKGLVILLWGVPGVGKTLTAESVASLAGKPLFSVGVSDIGLESTKVETNLQRVFDLAGLWEAVLLFDEADVFLEARDNLRSDIQRNTIVSVLLRVLEYYDGILILTTNRLKSFDVAVQSRIHIAIEYKDLEPKEKEFIFVEFLKQLKDKGLVLDKDWSGVTRWVTEVGMRQKFNGRQIRNVVSTAMGLAHADNRKLERQDLSAVALNTESFQSTLSAQDILYRHQHLNPQ